MPRNQTKKKKSLGAVTVSHFTLELFNAEVTEFNLATLLKPFALKSWEKERSGTGPNFSRESTKVSVAPNSLHSLPHLDWFSRP